VAIVCERVVRVRSCVHELLKELAGSAIDKARISHVRLLCKASADGVDERGMPIDASNVHRDEIRDGAHHLLSLRFCLGLLHAC
jgi:hypothetical protein